MKAAQVFIADIAEQISMPDVYSNIRELIKQQDSSINDFVEVIENDSMLSVRLMRIAHSPYFGFPRRAENLYQAISLIGIMQLHDLILNILSLRLFSSIPKQIFNAESFWKYSVETGIAARTIAQYSQIIPINPYFTLGLLHEIGHAVMFFKAPELSLQVLDDVSSSSHSQIELEQEIFGFDYTEAGTALMQLWHLPDRYQQVTACHLQPEQAHQSHRQALNIIHLAHEICQNPDAGQIRALIEQIKANDHQLKLLPDNIDEIILKEIGQNADSVLNTLWPHEAQDFPLGNGLHNNE